MEPLVHHVGDLVGRDYRRQREPVPDPLRHCDDVVVPVVPATRPHVPVWIMSWTSAAYFGPSFPKIPRYGFGFMACSTPPNPATGYFQVAWAVVFIMAAEASW